MSEEKALSTDYNSQLSTKYFLLLKCSCNVPFIRNKIGVCVSVCARVCVCARVRACVCV